MRLRVPVSTDTTGTPPPAADFFSRPPPAMENLLRVPPDVACPARALDGFRSREARKPYFTQLLTPSTSPQHLLAVCDEPSLMVLDKRRLKTPVQRIPLSGEESVTCVADVEDSHAAWLSASRGGFLALWDARASASAPQQRFAGPSGAPYLSLATSGPGSAAGTELQGADAFVDLWDLRQTGAPVLSYDEAHSDDVTTLTFHPDTAQHGGVLLSGGMDGLVCAIDTQIAEADDAVIAVGNTDASLARAGWARAPAQYVSPARPDAADKDLEEHDAALQNDPRRRALGPVYAVSNMQTLSVWDADKVRGPRRSNATNQQFDCAASELAVRSPTSFKPSWATDYVIDASGAYPVAPGSSDAVVTPMFVGDQEYVCRRIFTQLTAQGRHGPHHCRDAQQRRDVLDAACALP